MNTQDSHDRQRLRDAFRKPIYLAVRVTPEGFDVQEHHYPELQGRIVKATLARKLFDDGVLACASPDGIRADAGTVCHECQHPRCQPRLRLQLACGALLYVLDLPTTSAQNFFALEDQAEAQGARLVDWNVRLRVISREHWGEVTFKKIDSPRTCDS